MKMIETGFLIPAFEEADELVFPEIVIPQRIGEVLGIYTDPKNIAHVLQAFGAREDADLHYKEDQLYKRLTVQEHVAFTKRLYGAKQSVADLLSILRLEHLCRERVKKLAYSDVKKLHFLKYYVSSRNVLVMEEPFQNVNHLTKQTLIQRLHEMKEKKIVVISNNLADLVSASTVVYRLDSKGLKLLDVKSDKEESLKSEEFTNEEFRVDKIPTKKDDKIILFNPPEIDYIESVEGEVIVYVSGNGFVCSLTLAELERRLIPLGFFRCHRSYIVNLQKVREIITWTRNSYSLSIDAETKTTVPLSRNKLPLLKKLVGI